MAPEGKPTRVLDQDGDRWEELEDGRYAYVPKADGIPSADDSAYDDRDGKPWGPAFDLDFLNGVLGPVRVPKTIQEYLVGDLKGPDQ